MNSETKNCRNCKQSFVIEPEDFGFYEKMGVLPPTLCPRCRSQRRMAHRNDYQFYSRTCALCNQGILSIYSSNFPAPIYCPKCWWGDGWSALEYGQDFDFSKPFFPQFRELQNKVPALAILNDNDIASIGCQYTNYFALGKDCYLVINSWKVENCMYSSCLVGAKDIVDSTMLLSNCERIYSSVYTDNSSKSRNLYNCSGCSDCAYCYDCRGCTDCFMSIGLRNKRYCFKNEQLTKEEYEKILEDYKMYTWTGSKRAEKDFREFILRYPHRYANLKNCVDSTGEYLMNSKNAKHCFIAVRVENSKYFESGDTIKDSYDCLSGGEQELCYECINPDNSNRTAFTTYSHKDTDTFYSDSCQSSENIFGCVGLKKAQYCIFNKQYRKDEYQELRAKIVDHMKSTGEWGEFFPTNLSSFGYNETVAQDEYPLTREEALNLGFKWQDNIPKTKGNTTFSQIPNSIRDVSESIVNKILSCERCERSYKIFLRELQFYKQNNIPIPRYCSFCRLSDLREKRGPVRLWRNQCSCVGLKSTNGIYRNLSKHAHGEEACKNEFETAYQPGQREIIYCEACYNAEVV